MLPEESAVELILENPPEYSAGKSLLDKPLHQLTEDDIAQLTREDCRRYLKEKGMRRPSWNKSQAIQQVIMLKTLLEDDSEAGSRKRLRISRPNNSHSSVHKGTSRDTDKPDSSGGISAHFAAAAKDESAQPRTAGTTDIAAGQMTIFYCGKVNVYDDMPADKARAIMHIAASPLEFPDEQPNDATILKPLPCLSKAVSTNQDPADVILPTLQTVEGPSTRKASVQRYLEKKKERFKSKRKAEMTPFASEDMYFNNQMGSQIPIIDNCYPTKNRQPSTMMQFSG